MNKPRLLDLFCGAGGAAMGYHRAGFEVVGVDIKPQPHYPFEFHQADALEVLSHVHSWRGTGMCSGTMSDYVHWIDCSVCGALPSGSGYMSSDREHWRNLARYDAIHASPPCQAFSFISRFTGAGPRHADLIEPTRALLTASGLPWVMENVVPAPLLNPITLCGTMFGLGVFRHRKFESSELLFQPEHHKHPNRATPLRKRQKWQPGEYLTVTGHFAYPLAQVQAAMGIDWMRHAEITQAIPPAYTEWIGRQLLAALAHPAPTPDSTEAQNHE